MAISLATPVDRASTPLALTQRPFGWQTDASLSLNLMMAQPSREDSSCEAPEIYAAG